MVFLDLLLNSKYTIEEGDNRLFLTPVTGNTQMYNYPLYLIENEEEKYIACKGGFYQGFFKLYGYDYNVLPHKIDNEWVMHFDLRPRTDYEVDDMLVNYTHPDNDGIFFFMGTRAENKFWPFYKTNSAVTESMKAKDAQTEGHFNGCGESGTTYNIKENNVVFLENEWLSEELPEQPMYNDYFAVGDGYFTCEFTGTTENKFKPSTTKTIVTNGKYPTAKEGLNVYDFKTCLNTYDIYDKMISEAENGSDYNKNCYILCSYLFFVLLSSITIAGSSSLIGSSIISHRPSPLSIFE